MPSRLQIKVVEARQLPIMDKRKESTDAFVQVRFADIPEKTTRVINSNLNPSWRECFLFELSKDKQLQDAVVELKIAHQDLANDNIIGTVLIDISSLLIPMAPSKIHGWYPIYDSIKGLRGQLRIRLHLDFLDNLNEFDEASGAVPFLSMHGVMPGYTIGKVIGLAEGLIVDNDPEYDWKDSFRTPRLTNDKRQKILFRISGKLKRKIGRKVLDMGGNAVIGYEQNFDLEAEGGGGLAIVARGCGTAVHMVKKVDNPAVTATITIDDSDDQIISSSPVKHSSNFPSTPRRKSVATRTMTEKEANIGLLTIRIAPSNWRISLGAIVTARAVKIMKNTHRRRNRDKWWRELRQEIRSHALALDCNMVLGYTETITTQDEILLLTASGTACRLIKEKPQIADVPEAPDPSQSKKKESKKKKPNRKKRKKDGKCCLFHVPYDTEKLTGMFSQLSKCRFCKKQLVPDVVITTIEPPSTLSSMNFENGPQLVQARISRKNKKQESKEQLATWISETIPFLDLDLHRQLVRIMKHRGLNCCFNLRVQLSIGENLILAIATGTAFFIPYFQTSSSSSSSSSSDPTSSASSAVGSAFPPSSREYSSSPPIGASPTSSFSSLVIPAIGSNLTSPVASGSSTPGHHLSQSDFFSLPTSASSSSSQKQKKLTSSTGPSGSTSSSTETFSLSSSLSGVYNPRGLDESDTSSESGEVADMSVISHDLEDDEQPVSHFVIPLEEQDDIEALSDLLLEGPELPTGFTICNSETAHNLIDQYHYSNVQLFSIIYRNKWDSIPKHISIEFSKIFQSIFDDLTFNFLYSLPCVICDVQFDLQIPEENEIQITLTGTALHTHLTPSDEDSSLFNSLTIPPTSSSSSSSSRTHHSPILEPIKALSSSFSSFREDSMVEPPFVASKSSPEIASSTGTLPIVLSLTTTLENQSPPSFSPPRFRSLIPPSVPNTSGLIRFDHPIKITTMSSIPGFKIKKYLGRMCYHLIRENPLREDDPTFMAHAFSKDALEIARANVAALSGTALLSYRLESFVLNVTQKQGYFMMTLSGDIVELRASKRTK